MKCLLKLIILVSVTFVNAQNTIAYEYKYRNNKIAIFPKEYKDYLTDYTFTPTKEEIIKTEISLAKKIKEININRINQIDSPIIDKKLKKYNRQYFGNFDRDGKKYLIINFIWSKNCKTNEWLNNYISTLDGGSYFWSIKYYVEDDEFFDFQINGNS